ncbi:transcriptional regulator [Maribellus sp. YY47]|uniref:winged helix-turn-helix domain-containing protein n=1 Tax=Maribellus sp. YY47 TaxID=2929486 RepID=UPI002000E729|nr:transcriptional regulator [Maribellus sp. YY47]
MKSSFQNLNKAFDNKIRLGIMSVLSVNSRSSFNQLKEVLEVTDGNLASHLKALESAGYIAVNKSFINRKPNTNYEITPSGAAAFESHLQALEEILKQL